MTGMKIQGGAMKLRLGSVIVVLLTGIMVFGGCSMKRKVSKMFQATKVIISFESTQNVNDGVLLPVDVIAGDEQMASMVLGIGPDAWFADPLRDRLSGEQIHKLAISGNDTREITVHLSETTRRIIVYADYDRLTERAGQQIVIIPESIGFSKTYTIRLKDTKMEMLQ
jgi:predicted component of type VI protein secretion system